MTLVKGLDVDCVLLDLDGTLLDSERAICDAAAAAFADVDVRVAELQIADHMGAPLEELYALFVGDQDEERMRRFIKHYIERHDAHPDRFPPPLPGVVDGLAALVARGLPLSVATTKPSARARSQLEGAGLERFFRHVQGTDPGMKPKPAPDVVLHGCAALGTAPARALMIGDTPRDVAAARAAGTHAIVVAYSEPRVRAARSMGADAVITSLSEL